MGAELLDSTCVDEGSGASVRMAPRPFSGLRHQGERNTQKDDEPRGGCTCGRNPLKRRQARGVILNLPAMRYCVVNSYSDSASSPSRSLRRSRHRKAAQHTCECGGGPLTIPCLLYSQIGVDSISSVRGLSSLRITRSHSPSSQRIQRCRNVSPPWIR